MVFLLRSDRNATLSQLIVAIHNGTPFFRSQLKVALFGFVRDFAKPRGYTRVMVNKSQGGAIKRKGGMIPTPPPSSGQRGNVVVARVFASALEELARNAYGAFRMEEVARLAGVHKTTVYRRWPTKRELIRDALLARVQDRPVPPDTGSLRNDLIFMIRHGVEFMTSVLGQGVMRMLMSEMRDPEVVSLGNEIRERKECGDALILARAVARGELRPDVDFDLLLGSLFGTVHSRLFVRGQSVDELFISRLVDLMLLGAIPRAEEPTKSMSKGRAKKVPSATRRSDRRAR